MAKVKEKETAQKLRKQGNSIGDIAVRLGVSKSTVSHWCKDIPLSESALLKISRRSKTKSTFALLKHSETQRRKRIENIAEASIAGAKMVQKLTDREVFCIGLGLYWGEGYKKGSQEFGFTNSDIGMIKFYIQWLQTVFDVKKEDLILRVSINEVHKNRVSAVQKYWSVETQIPELQFTKISLIKSQSKKLYSNVENHYGTLRVKVRRGTQLRRQVLGAIATLSQNM